ncbi:hypothetical protein LguiA_010920 [Lonicera macranthoides]
MNLISTMLCDLRFFFKKMIGFVIVVLQVPVIIVISLGVILFTIYMLAKAIISDISHALKEHSKESINHEEEAKRRDMSIHNSVTPIVLVHGVFGFGEGKMGHLSHFGGLEKKYEQVFVPDLGLLTSLHDRARELFYYLKGGQVDCGEEHSKAFGHSQFGRFYKKGKYSEWDDEHPIHFVGHSAGAQTIRVLQQMLADKAFKGHENTSENWVASVTSLCGALNGSTRTYITGMKPEEWKSMEPICVLQLLRVGVIFMEWLDIWWLKKYSNYGFDHFNMSWRKIGIRGLVDCLVGNSGPFGSGDWVLPDLTLQGSMEINSQLNTFPNTFYLSYAGKVTKKKRDGSTVPSCVPSYNLLLLLQVFQICTWRYPLNIPPPYNGYRDEDWLDNDGELNTISMTHPHIPTEHPHRFLSNDSELPSQPGIWYYKILEAHHHTEFVAPGGQGECQYSELYDTVFNYCRNLVIKKTPPMHQNHAELLK